MPGDGFPTASRIVVDGSFPAQSSMKKLLLTIDRDGERWLLLVLYIYIVAVIFVEVVRRFVW